MAIPLGLDELSKLLLVASDMSYGASDPIRVRVGLPLASFNDTTYGIECPYSILSGYQVREIYNDPAPEGTGFKAVAFLNVETSEVIIAMAGTDGPDSRDWLSNSRLGWDQWTANKSKIFSFLDTLGFQPSKIHFTGQSLGGGLAEYAAYEYLARAQPEAREALKSRTTLVTFNGFGGQTMLSRELGNAFVPNMLADLSQSGAFFVANDLVSRLGGGHVGMPTYRLDYASTITNPDTDSPYLLGIKEAHRIETAFYPNLVAGRGFNEAKAASQSMLAVAEAQRLAALWGSVLADRLLVPSDAKWRIPAGVAGSLAFAPSEDVDELGKALISHLYAAGDLGSGEIARKNIATLKVVLSLGALRAAGTFTVAAWSILGSAFAHALGADAAGKAMINDGFRKIADFNVTVSDNSDTDGGLQAAMLLATVPDAFSDPHAEALAAIGVNQEELATTILNGGNDWLPEALGHLQGKAVEAGYSGQSLVDLHAHLLAFAKNARDIWAAGDSSLQARVDTALHDFILDDFARALANANIDFTNKYAQAGMLFQGSTLDFVDYAPYERALAAAVSDPAFSNVRDLLEEALATVSGAGQTVVIRSGGGTNPFDDPTFDPNASPASTGALDEGSVSVFTVFLPYEASEGGQRIKLNLEGAAADKLKVYAGEEEVELQADGVFTLTVAEGQREVSFEIFALEDVDADATLQVSAQLVSLVDGSELATHQERQELVLSLDAEAETAAGGLEYRGDWEVKYYPRLNPDGTPAVDDLGQPIYESRIDARYPHIENVERTTDSIPDMPAFYQIGGVFYLAPLGPTMSYIRGYEGADHVWMGVANGTDVTRTFDGDDQVTGSEFAANAIYAGAGSDWVEGGAFADHAEEYLEFSFSGRTIKFGDDKIHGGAGDDQIWGESETTQSELQDPSVTATGLPGDWIAGGSGADRVYGSLGDDVLLGGTGEDLMVGGAGMDVLLGDDDFGIAVQGNFWRVMHTNFGDATFSGFEVGLFPIYNYAPLITNPTDIDPNIQDPYVSYYKQGGGADTLIGGAGKDILIGQFGDDVLYGGADDDILAGWEGQDQLISGEGDDKIAGDFGRYEQPSQRLIAGPYLGVAGLAGSSAFDASQVDQVGNDFLDGGGGNDTLFGEGGDDVVYGRDGADVLYGDANYLPEELHGDDLLDGGAADDVLFGGSGDDKLYGGDGNDELAGGSGSDLLEGGTGNDLLAGDQGDDVLRGGEGADELLGGAGADQLRGGAGDDQLAGNDDNDAVYGDAGADSIDGGTGADILYGGSGEDIIEGGDGDDLIDGGAGIDIVRGGVGNDTYLIGVGYGQDLIEDAEGANRIRFGSGILSEDLSAELDSVTLAATLTFGAAGDSVIFDAGQVQIGGVEFSNGASWTKAAFVNFLPAVVTQGSNAGELVTGNANLRNELRGEGGHDDLKGASYDDFLAGGDGYDSLGGGSGSDRYFFAADESGIDSISDTGLAARAYLEWFYDSRGIADWAERGEHGGEYRAEAEGEGGVFVAYFETYEEAYAEYPNAAITYLEPLPEIAPLITRNDTQALAEISDEGVLDRDVVEFGAGLALSDLELTITVPGAVAGQYPEQPWYGGGTLSVRWGAAGFNVEVPDVSYGFVGTNLLTDGVPQEEESTDGSWRGYRLGEGIEAFEFADGTTYTLEEILQQAAVVLANDYMAARGSGAHTLDAGSYTGIRFDEGISASEVRIERSGTDLSVSLTDLSASVLLEGWFANPPELPNLSLRFADDPAIDPGQLTRVALTQNGTEFDDELDSVDGFANELYGKDGQDTLTGGTGDDYLDGGDGSDSLLGGGGNDELRGGAGFFDVLEGGSGNDVLVGGEGEDQLRGEDGDDVVDGGAGDDFLEGNAGDDVYVLGDGYGQDLVSEDEDDGGAGFDTVRFATGIAPADVLVERGDYGDLILSINGGADSLTIFGWFRETAGTVERLEFADGTTWDSAAVEAQLPTADAPTEEADTVVGLTGGDSLYGLAGDDELYGFAGDDVLEGGAGYDYLEGGKGDDTYLFSPGDGGDELYEDSGDDRVLFGSGITPEDVQISRDPYSLLIDIGGQGDTITVWDWLYDPRRRIERLEFADGTVWDEAEVWSQFEVAAATGEDDLLLGTDADDVLDGLEGNDEIWAYEGNDLLAGGEGDDLLEGGPGANLLEGGAGFDSLGQQDGPQRNLHIGGAGDDDTGTSDGGPTVVAFNAGDGVDVVSAGTGQPLVLSLGGLTLGDMAGMRREFGSVILEFGTGDALRLDGFYQEPARWPVGVLQVIGTDIRRYDLNAVIAAFDQAQEEDPESWSVNQALQDNLLSVSTTHAFGGAIAYQYATTGSTGALSTAEKQAILGDADFAIAAQSIVPGGANQSPVLDEAIADQSANEDAAFSFAVPADAFSDPDAGDTLTYTASLQGGAALPAWLSFDPETRTFSGTPLQADVGAIDVKVTATDGGGLAAEDSFTVTVANVNDAPAVSAVDATVLLGGTLAASALFSVFDEDGTAPAQYELWDSTAGNGRWTVGGVEQGVNVAIALADLGDVEFAAAAATGSDLVWARAYDGEAWSAWKSWTINSWPHLTNAVPVVTAANGELLLNDFAAASSLFSVSDADSDAIVQYEFWDDVAGGGYFSLDGVAQSNNPIPVSAAQLADLQYVAGAQPGTERVWVRASDAMGWSAWKAWNMTSALHIPNAAPEASAAASQTILLNETVQASALFSVTDADGDPIAYYELWDSSAGNGRWTVGGVEQGVNVAIPVVNLEDAQFVGAASSGSDLLWVRASDGQSWGDWKSWTVNSWPHLTNAAPVASAQDATILTNEAVAASSLFSVSDADGDTIERYELWDDVAGGGYWRLEGVQQAAGQAIDVLSSDLNDMAYVGGASGGTERVWVRAHDGLEWGAWEPWNITTALHIPNAVPVVSAPNATILLGQAVDAPGLFSVSDADGDAITRYELWDSTAGNGQWTVNGVGQGVNVAIAVSAADLANTRFAAAAATGSDLVWVRANDGQEWSDWKSWTMNSWPHLTNAAPAVAAANDGLLRGEAVAASGLFEVTDADGDAIARYELWDDVNGGGHWSVDGVQQAAAQAIGVDAADLANTAYVGGANAGTEQVWVRAYDGMGWSAWKNWLMSTEGGMLRGGLGPDTLAGEAGPTVLEGGAGDDSLTDTEGNNLLSGGEGDDAMTGGDGNDFFAGGAGNDTVQTGGGSNIIAYNAGSGLDTVFSATGASNTLSLGGGIGYDDLSLSKDGNDLIVNTGTDEGLVLRDWYAGANNVENLQIVLDASDDFDSGSSDPLYNRKVQSFDFLGLVAEFDQALIASPGLTSWAVTNALLQFHLSGADDMALGGDLAYWYGKNGGLTGISLAAAQQVIGASGFGSDAQTLRPFSGLQEGFVKLA